MTGKNAITQLTDAMSDLPAPIYQRVKQAIISQIAEGIWKPNLKIPSENELVSSLGVSRMTINRALRELTSEGFLIRMQGVGTFVAESKGYTEMLEVHNIADEIKMRGHQHTSRTIWLAEVRASAEQAALLGLRAGQNVFSSRIIHYENGVPVQLEDRLVNPQGAPDYLNHDYQTQTPYTYLMNVAPLSAGEHIVEAVMADSEQQQLLEIDDREPCLLIRRQTWSQSTVVTYSKFLYPGTRYKLLGKFNGRGQ
ncbi:histidine utilization repressor [Tatumella sp. UBA2305]|uniref:histidine utilization repressor n=1 Tax=Tatumella sp. UBA2305 TaxID=1947647 RepID=UPI0025D15D5A|nr:histidine utilization repressor [Tatumella sp. UBA2305]